MTALGELVIAHSIRVGGYEFDDAIVRAVQEQQQLIIGQEQAEKLKIEVGSALEQTGMSETGEVAGRDPVTGLLRRASVDGASVRAALERPLSQIVEAIKNLLERTPPELSADVADRGLMLVGGGALMRGLDELIRRETGLRVQIDEDALTTVARGAGKALEQQATVRPRPARRTTRSPRFG